MLKQNVKLPVIPKTSQAFCRRVSFFISSIAMQGISMQA